MNKNIVITILALAVILFAALQFYPKQTPAPAQSAAAPTHERKILYWTDAMIPGDRSDHPGKSPMGMDRTPVYANDSASGESTETVPAHQQWYCPMHPNTSYDHPGPCPICGMTMVKRLAPTTSAFAGGAVHLTPERVVLANIATSVAEEMPGTKSIPVNGTITYAEPNFRHISTRFAGRLDKLYLTYTGQHVSKGDPVAEVYSPDAISAQQEYLIAREAAAADNSAEEALALDTTSLLYQARLKLLRWGFSAQQIAALDTTQNVSNALTIYSPISGTVLKKSVDPQHYAMAGEDMYDVADLSTVWGIMNVYENELAQVHTGQTVTAQSNSYPGEYFTGKITFIGTTVDVTTRSVPVRVEFANPTGKLKIDMYVTGEIGSAAGNAVMVPSTAVLSTGTHEVVWVRQSAGVYEPRLVQTGAEANGFTQILSGVVAGESVVTNGGYLIDSESQLQSNN
jgi:Cu(I)/Ag(I) efflux system membrane fusion protein